jgi:hypothetical protein
MAMAEMPTLLSAIQPTIVFKPQALCFLNHPCWSYPHFASLIFTRQISETLFNIGFNNATLIRH